MDFLKMVEAQAMEWEARKLQILSTTTNPITGDSLGDATQGVGALVGAINTISKATADQGGRSCVCV
jgi:hypothetical protein